jgi:ribulose-phosphate 3-epimerase
MAIIVPTVTATEPHAYREQLDKAIGFAKRIHIDLADGQLAPVKLLHPLHIWLPEDVICDIHVMFKSPVSIQQRLIDLRPRLVVFHSEADGDFYELTDKLKAAGIKVGLALLADTPVEVIGTVAKDLDHVLIFSGDLGHYGGHADLNLLRKVDQLKELNPNLEIGWDGGINDQNVRQLVDGGIDVLNVGGFIQRSDNPQAAYDKLEVLISSHS